MAKRKSNKQVKQAIVDVIKDATGESEVQWIYFSCLRCKHFAEIVVNHESVFDEYVYTVGKPVSIKA